MDVTKIISNLRAERAGIESAIRILTTHDNMNLAAKTHRNGQSLRGELDRRTAPAKDTAAHSVIEIRGTREPQDGS